MDDTAFDDRLIAVGETITRTLRYSREDIAQFARLSSDQNPLHVDAMVAQRARFGEIIASGQHTAAILMGMLATHFSRSDDGVARQMLCLNMNLAFKAPVFAEQELVLYWRVATVEWSEALDGWLAHVDGRATVRHANPCVIARGTLLVKAASS